jgi:hypothetical protein
VANGLKPEVLAAAMSGNGSGVCALVRFVYVELSRSLIVLSAQAQIGTSGRFGREQHAADPTGYRFATAMS